jgi:hypothetical protein
VHADVRATLRRRPGAVESSLKVYDFHRRAGNALIVRYSEIVNNPERAVRGVADYLGLETDDQAISEVVEETSIERVGEIARALEDDVNNEQVIRGAAIAYDPATLVHPRHVRDGGYGYGRRLLTAEQLDAVNALSERYARTRHDPSS